MVIFVMVVILVMVVTLVLVVTFAVLKMVVIEVMVIYIDFDQSKLDFIKNYLNHCIFFHKNLL